MSPSTLLLVEGSGQLAYAMNWGDGFVTDRTKIASYGLADANVFFGALLSKPYLSNVVISPHYYPPSGSKQQSGCAVLRAGFLLPDAWLNKPLTPAARLQPPGLLHVEAHRYTRCCLALRFVTCWHCMPWWRAALHKLSTSAMDAFSMHTRAAAASFHR